MIHSDINVEDEREVLVCLVTYKVQGQTYGDIKLPLRFPLKIWGVGEGGVVLDSLLLDTKVLSFEK